MPAAAGETFHVGDEWFIEATAKAAKTKAAVNPTTVTCAVYAPSEWDSQHDDPIGAGKSVSLPKTGEGAYENAAGVALTEAGIWRCLITTGGTYVGIEPDLITVNPTFPQ